MKHPSCLVQRPMRRCLCLAAFLAIVPVDSVNLRRSPRGKGANADADIKITAAKVNTEKARPQLVMGTSRRMVVSGAAMRTSDEMLTAMKVSSKRAREELIMGSSRHEMKEASKVNAAPTGNPGCLDCCNDGDQIVPCLDVDQCAAQGPKSGKYAFVFTFTGVPHGNWMPFLDSVKQVIRKHKEDTIDLVLIMPKKDAKRLTANQTKVLADQGVILHQVDWAVPPDMKFQRPFDRWCGPQDLIRLHALALPGYDAVAYYDTDIEMQGDVMPVFRCAATGKFLSTNGGIGEPLNVGFFALRPDPRMLQAARNFARETMFNETTGWSMSLYRPSGGYYVGAECGQGFFHTLFYKKKSQPAQRALQEAGLAGVVQAAQIDRCIWNYQTTFQCKHDFDCRNVRAHHKPMKRGSDKHECMKLSVYKHEAEERQKKAQVVASIQEKPNATFGFYFPIYNQIAPVLRVVGSVRKFYPDSPILLLQDGGHIGFNEVCKLPKYNCSFEAVPGENSRWNPHSWMKRFHSAAQKLGTTYVIYLEPDVEVKHRHTIEPPLDAGGIYDNFNPASHGATIAYLEQHGRERKPCFEMKWFHFGLAGGSYFRTEAVLDAFDPRNIKRIDWLGLFNKETKKVFSSDVAMHMALSFRGYDVYPWAEAAQNFEHRGLPTNLTKRAAFAKQWPAYNPLAAFEHDHKEHYADKVPEDEMKLIQYLPRTPEFTCHGCLWFTGEMLNGKALPVPSKPPAMTDKTCVFDPNQKRSPGCINGKEK